MDRYQLLSHLGSGRFGTVWKALDQTNDDYVAIKKLHQKYELVSDFLSMEELQSLSKLKNHVNIVKLKNFIYEKDEVFYVLELMDNDLRQHMVKHIIHDEVFTEAQIRNYMAQILQGLEHMHMVGYFHRDLKLENILVSKNVIKIGDLGSATRIKLGTQHYVSNITTPCYRAPEMLLQSKLQNSTYGAPIDIWAVGIIMVELYTLMRLFGSKCDVEEQLSQMCGVFGAPSKETWADGIEMANAQKIKIPEVNADTPLLEIIPNASVDAIDLIRTMCSWDPGRRPRASQALQHPFFH